MKRQTTYRTDLTLGHLSQSCKLILDILSDYSDYHDEEELPWAYDIEDDEHRDEYVKEFEKIISDIEEIKQAILNGTLKIIHDNPITKVS